MNAGWGRGAGGCHGNLIWRCRALSASLLIAAIAGLLLAISCTPTPTPAPQAAIAPTAPRTSAPAEGTRSPALPATPVSTTAALTLTIWGPDALSPTEDTPGGQELAAQIAAFTQAHPGWSVRYVRKRPYGTGGITHFLRAARTVAPESLPDLVLIDMREVGLLAGDSLLQPLEPILGADAVGDLLPFAREAGQVGDHLLAAQYAADIHFLAYDSEMIAEPPATWTQVLATGAGYLLPIGASEGAVSDALLPLYLSLGGKVWDRDGRPYLDETVLTTLFESYRAARQSGILPNAGLDLQGASDCWPIYLTGQAPSGALAVAMTNVSSWDYGRDRSRLAKTRFGPLPTLSGAPVSVSSGWGWAVITRDSRRLAVASDFLRTLMQPEAMAAWSQATFHLPARRSALALTIKDPGYLRFLEKALGSATPEPREPAYSQIVAALSPAIESVSRGLVSPQAAAVQAAERVRITSAQPRSTLQY